MISPDARVLPFRGARPILGDDVFLASGALVLGDVILAEETSVWYNVVIRGDVNFIRIGRGTNVQDLSVIHGSTDAHAVRIGDGVTIGHGVMIHGATLDDGCLIGMGSVVLDGAH